MIRLVHLFESEPSVEERTRSMGKLDLQLFGLKFGSLVLDLGCFQTMNLSKGFGFGVQWVDKRFSLKPHSCLFLSVQLPVELSILRILHHGVDQSASTSRLERLVLPL